MLTHRTDGTAPLIEIRHATVEFSAAGKAGRTLKAVDDVSLRIERHDIVGIVGFSGAGKSTLVRTINVLQRLTSGSVSFAGQNISDLPERRLKPIRRKIAMIFQQFNLMATRCVLDNVLFPLKRERIGRREAVAKAMRLLDLVGIADKAQAYPRQLSGGQRQRVAIARALACDPEVLLCDEATSALDPRTTRSILALLKRLNRELGLTIVLITHEMQVVKDICTKVAVMQQGRVVEQGTLLDVFAHPRSALAAEFIHTSSNMDKGIALVREHPLFADARAHGRVFLLSAVGTATQETLMSDIHRLFGVSGSIVFGNVDVVDGTPVGMVLVSLDGDEEGIRHCLEHFASVGVRATALNEIGAVTEPDIDDGGGDTWTNGARTSDVQISDARTSDAEEERQ